MRPQQTGRCAVLVEFACFFFFQLCTLSVFLHCGLVGNSTALHSNRLCNFLLSSSCESFETFRSRILSAKYAEKLLSSVINLFRLLMEKMKISISRE